MSWSIDAGSSSAGCSITAGVLTCNFGTLAPGASKSVHIVSHDHHGLLRHDQ